MVVRDFGNLRDLGRTEFVSFRKVGECRGIVLGFEGGETKETPRRAQLRVQLNDFREGRAGFSKVVRVVLQGTEVPPPLFPLRMYLQGLLVEADRVVRLTLLAGGGGVAGKVFEIPCVASRRNCLA